VSKSILAILTGPRALTLAVRVVTGLCPVPAAQSHATTQHRGHLRTVQEQTCNRGACNENGLGNFPAEQYR
jgi:hypothetical protein